MKNFIYRLFNFKAEFGKKILIHTQWTDTFLVRLIRVSTFSLLLCFFSLSTFAQKREKEPEYNYLSLGYNIFTNAPGSLKEKSYATMEFGRSFGIFDLGLMLGRFSFLKTDSSWFIELIPTINVFSKGRFSEALTLGAGYIFNAKNNFLTEITNSINFAPSNQIVIALSEGNYFMDGRFSISKAQYIAVSLTYNFISPHTRTERLKKKSLLN